MINCSSKHADDYFDLPDSYLQYEQKWMNKFVQKYWHLVDQDNSGSLNLDEFKYTMGGLALVNAQGLIKVRKLSFEPCNFAYNFS